MFSPDQYALLDFGDGRKLERFGALVLDRPAPAAEQMPRGDRAVWSQSDASYRRRNAERGQWVTSGRPPSRWEVRHGTTVFELHRSASGAVGLFPEQAENWDWLRQQVRRADSPLRVLNLFAYTGGSTLAAVAAGAQVVHVDAARPVVAWARRNAALSGLQDAPIRWIVEDARKFTHRELRRGNQYDAVILDPPTYGHGPKSQPWQLREHLDELLRMCGRLTERRRAFMLVTCHTPGVGPADLEAMLSDAVFGHCQSGVVAGPLMLRTREGRRLPAGLVARWPG